MKNSIGCNILLVFMIVLFLLPGTTLAQSAVASSSQLASSSYIQDMMRFSRDRFIMARERFVTMALQAREVMARISELARRNTQMIQTYHQFSEEQNRRAREEMAAWRSKSQAFSESQRNQRDQNASLQQRNRELIASQRERMAQLKEMQRSRLRN